MGVRRAQAQHGEALSYEASRSLPGVVCGARVARSGCVDTRAEGPAGIHLK
jgi:hypothetical protein